jgi:hypothetical protein
MARTGLIALVGVVAGICFAAAFNHVGGPVEGMRIGVVICSVGRC